MLKFGISVLEHGFWDMALEHGFGTWLGTSFLNRFFGVIFIFRTLFLERLFGTSFRNVFLECFFLNLECEKEHSNLNALKV